MVPAVVVSVTLPLGRDARALSEGRDRAREMVPPAGALGTGLGPWVGEKEREREKRGERREEREREREVSAAHRHHDEELGDWRSGKRSG